MRIRVVKRSHPAAGAVYEADFPGDPGCANSTLAERNLYASLDASDRPTPVPSNDGPDFPTPTPTPGKEANAQQDDNHPDKNEQGEVIYFPYRITDSDPEIIDVGVETSSCDCAWVIDLDWASGGDSGTVTIDDGGKPFRTSASAVKDSEVLFYDGHRHKWVPA